MINLDHNATTPLLDPVRDAMMPFLWEAHGNPSSPHSAGTRAKQAVGEARSAVAALIGAKAAEIVFTASATEANHTAITGALRSAEARDPARRGLVVSAVEHPATLLLAEDLARRGYPVSVIPVDGAGRLDLGALAAAVGPQTAVVSVLWANNETGVLSPVAEVAAIAHAAGALFHTDAVQAAGRIPVRIDAAGADLLTLSAHKMHGPKGAGALFVRKGADITPLIHGHQERGRRGGTENVAALVGFGVAARLAAEALAADAGGAMAAVRDRLERGVLARWPGAKVNGAGAERLPNTSSIRFADAAGRPVDAEELLMRLDRAGVLVSMGAACASGGNAPSHVLTAMGLSAADAAATLRFSLGIRNSEAEVDAVLGELSSLFTRMAA